MEVKEVVEGRGHAFIWDVEEDDPACIESEREVMETGRTCVSEETIQTGEGTKLLTTYKSPLYDFDGNVMGTVGVAIDITRGLDTCRVILLHIPDKSMPPALDYLFGLVYRPAKTVVYLLMGEWMRRGRWVP